MIILALIGALILIESREIFQGLLSQPFVTGIILIFAGYDQNMVLAVAVLTHLIYLNRTPSGTTLHPEYPFAYFMTVAVLKPDHFNAVYFVIQILIIILLSKMTAHLISYKRNLFGRFRNRFILSNGYPNIPLGILFSLSLFFAFSFIITLILKNLIPVINYFEIYYPDILHDRGIIITLCLIPALYYAYKNIRSAA